jgi:hypothetical protein
MLAGVVDFLLAGSEVGRLRCRRSQSRERS